MSSVKRIDVQELPEQTAVAAYELAAKLLREEVSALEIDLTLSDEGQPLGRFQLSLKKID
jgi:hypothetical protein